MFKRRLLVLSAIIFVLLVIPAAFAEENATDTLEASLDGDTLSSDYYFDSNATNDHGRGTIDDPYKELRDGRILDGAVIHLKNGEYEFSPSNTHSRISIIGEDSEKTIINGKGGILLANNRLVLENVTICNLNIYNQGNLMASNTIFANSSAIKSSDEKSMGGAIYCVDSKHNAYLTNCTFINNNADCGGAIYLNGGILELTDCAFINNSAAYYGGAIACESGNSKSPRITVKRSKFINDTSLGDAGGAIYLKCGTFSGQDINVSSCSATFGGAFSLLKSYSTLDNVNAFANDAKYNGGVIYQIYGNLTINNSQMLKNHAKNGGALFVEDSYSLDVLNVSFINNSAILVGGAFYSLENDYFDFKNLTYINNTAFAYDDLFSLENTSLIFSGSNYTLYNNVLDDSPLPSYYNSADMGYVTPVKDQEDAGNCWSFAILSALESSILKASGDTLILSEENMKNLASLYSHFGWDMDTNDGGYDDMGLGYLTSWLGPILEIDDEYSDFSVLSPVLDSILHVQNIIYLKRSSYTDNDEVKRAIRDYGAVYTPIYMVAHYDSSIRKYAQYYSGNHACDHAVIIVGWDDSIKVSGAPGRGAWIAKNSWGTDWGSDGYFYVSYYDKSCLRVDENEGGFAFAFDDTMKYDKNYQYDIAKTDYFYNTTRSVWYKNVFTATDNEYLAAVSTYFEKNTRWELTINVNDELKLSKSGNSHAGYRTLDLGQLIPLSIGDIFEVIFKITVDEDAGVPISEAISLNNCFYHENISYISYDGRSWRDMFNITWEYPDHTYESQVACIKAFTILNEINTTLALTYEDKTDDQVTIVANVFNQWGYPVDSGKVIFKVGNETYIIEIVDGVAKKRIDLISANVTAEFSQTGYNPSMGWVEMRNPMVITNITLNVTGVHNPVNITAYVVDEYGEPARFGNVIFIIGDATYSVDVANGTAKLENIEIFPLKSTIHAEFTDLLYYNSSSIDMPVEILLIATEIHLNITTNEYNNPVGIVAHVLDEYGNPVEYGEIAFYMSNELFKMDVVNGTASINHTFRKAGNNTIYVTFYDNEIYNSSVYSQTLLVSKMKVNLTFDIVINELDVYMAVGIRDSARGFTIKLKVNDDNHIYSSTESYVMCELKDLKKGSYNYTIELVSPIYEADILEGTFNITHQKTQIIASDSTLYYNGEYYVTLKDDLGDAVSGRDLYLTINGQTMKMRTDELGIAMFNIEIPEGTYDARVSFIGDDEYIRSSKTVTITLKSTVEFKSYTYTYNSNYMATLRDCNGNLLKNIEVNLVLNGVAYKIMSDENGQISLNVNLNPGSYLATVINPGTGEVKSQTISVVKRITQNSALTMYYGAGKYYKVKVVDDYGKAAKGLKVTFKISGKTYYAYTDANGYASIKITKNPGKYMITAEYKGYKVSNKVTVKSTIVTKDIKVKKGKTIKFKAKLLNSKGKILKNKKITFKFKGKTYKVKTNKKGIATLKITKKYKKGKYTITSKYGSLKIKNSVRIV